MLRRYVYLLLGLCLLAVPASAQFLNMGRLADVFRSFEQVFDNSGNPWPFFSMIAAINYDQGGQGVAVSSWNPTGCGTGNLTYRPDANLMFLDASDATEPFSLGCLKPGDYEKITTNFSVNGPYAITIDVSNTEVGASWQVLLDSVALPINNIAVPNTGNLHVFQAVTSQSFNAALGNHVVTLRAAAAGPSGFVGNINWFEGVQAGTGGVPIITVTPSAPSIQDTQGLGAVVAGYGITMSDNSTFIGTVGFGPPNNDNGARYSLTATNGQTGNIVVNPSGPGLGTGPRTDNITMLATTVPPTIGSVAFGGFTTPVAAGGQAGTIAVTMTAGSFIGGTLRLATTAPTCSGTASADNGRFTVSGMNLLAGTTQVTAGTYHICFEADLPGATNTPFFQASVAIGSDNAGIPPPAMAAGFTNPINVMDFTKALPVGWLGSCPTGADGTFVPVDLDGTHRWWAGWGFFPQSFTCNKIPAGEANALPGAAAGGSFQDTDPVFGNLALHQTTNSDVTTDGTFYWASGAQMGTTPSSSAGGDYTLVNGFNQHNDYPNGFYIEETYRLSPTNGVAPDGQPVGPFQGLNSWTTLGLFDNSSRCVLQVPPMANCLAGNEWDPGEMQTSTGGIDPNTGNAYGGMDGAVHNWAGAGGLFAWTSFGNGPPPFPPFNFNTNFNFNGYNKVGLLVTSDGSTDMVGCWYVGPENGPIVAITPCTRLSGIGPINRNIYGSGVDQFAQRNAFELQTACGPNGSGPGNSGHFSPCPPPGVHGDNYVKNIKIYICPNGAAGDGHACDRALITTPPPYQ